MHSFYIQQQQVICIFYLREVMNTDSDSDARKFDDQKIVFLEFENRFVCLWQGADLHMAQLMPLPQPLAPVDPDWFYLSGTGLPG